MSTQQVLQIGGAAVGFLIGGPAGAQLGFMAGSGLGLLVPPDRPDPGDLSAPQINAGTAMSRGYGTFKRTLSPIWMSQFHEVQGGGKGGEPPSLSFTIDVIFLATHKTDVQVILRAWVNKKIEFTALAASSGSSIAASLLTNAWESIELADGNPAQTPWSVHETAKGAGNVSAFRGITTVRIRGLNCGGSKSLPLVEAELSTSATLGAIGPVVQLTTGLNLDAADASYFNHAPSFFGTAYAFDGTSIVIGPTTSATGVQWAGASLAIDPAQGFTLEGRGTWDSGSNDFPIVVSYTDSGFYWYAEALPVFPSGWNWRISGADLGSSLQLGPNFAAGTFSHIALVIPAGANQTARVYIDGALVYTFTNTHAGGGASGTVSTFKGSGGPNAQTFRTDFVALRRGEIWSADFTAPPLPPEPDFPLDTWLPGQVSLSSIIDHELEMNEAIDLADWDTSACDAIMVDEYQCSGPTADAVAKLCDMYYVDLVPGNPLRFMPRGLAPVATLTNAEVGEPGKPFSGLKEDNDDEQPAIAGLQFPDRLNNHDPGFVQADRVSPASANVRSLSTLVGFTPSAAKGRAIAYNLLRQAARYTADSRWSDRRSTLQPGDAIYLPDEKGNLYNLLIRASTYDGTTHQAKLELNDTSALVYTGTASTDDRNAITVVAPAVAEFMALDLPNLRGAADNDAGYWGLVKTGTSTGARWLDSPDDVAYTQRATYANDATFGTVTAATGAFTPGPLFGEGCSLTVDVGDGTLASATRDALLADRSLNAFTVGVNGRLVLGQFRTAALVSAGVYTLTGFVNLGDKGTEQYCAGITAGDGFALLGVPGMDRIDRGAADLAVPFFVKGVTDGATAAAVDGVPITEYGIALKPISPVLLVAARDSSTGDILVSWTRRTRMPTRFGGALGDSCPLGEAAELYHARLYTSGAFTTLLRDFGTVAAASLTYTAAQRATDGHSLANPLYLDVRMVSDVVGEGYPLQDAA
jgi:hypothetical protein